jgi:hypothetical protein
MTIKEKKRVGGLLECKKCEFKKIVIDTLYINTCSGNCWFAYDSKINILMESHMKENPEHYKFWISTHNHEYFTKSSVEIR